MKQSLCMLAIAAALLFLAGPQTPSVGSSPQIKGKGKGPPIISSVVIKCPFFTSPVSEYIGSTVQIDAMALDKSGNILPTSTIAAFAWNSSNPGVAIVPDGSTGNFITYLSGVELGLSKGSADITFTAVDATGRSATSNAITFVVVGPRP